VSSIKKIKKNSLNSFLIGLVPINDEQLQEEHEQAVVT
jgi:hypothetical protein